MTIDEKIEGFIPLAESMPGVVVVHRLDGFTPVYMTSNGLELLGISFEQLMDLGKDYQKKFLNEDFIKDYLLFLDREMKDNEAGKTYNTFHQVLLKDKQSFDWYITSVKVFHEDEEGTPTHAVSIAFPLGDLQHIPQKADKILEEILFFRKNREKFLGLSSRGREVLRLVASGKSSAEIAEELNISVDTVNSHRRLVKEKLGISSGYQFAKYARSFDLI